MKQHHISVIVSRKRFANNIRILKEYVYPAKLSVVMKADAYGHGLAGLVETAITAGADSIGISTNPEAHMVRAVSQDFPLIRLRMALPEELKESVAELNIEEQVGTWEASEYLSCEGIRRGLPVSVHLTLDTGMGRGGFGINEIDTIRRVIALPGLRIVGVMAHYANADATTMDYSLAQNQKFDRFVEALALELPDDVLFHTHNSAATMRLPNLRRDMVRVGAACYGVKTSHNFSNLPDLKPCMMVKTRITQVRNIPAATKIGYGSLYTTKRPSRIAAIPVGFGEGYPRALFNKGIVLIGGHRCPVVGRVSLNITTIDVTDLPHVPKWGDEVVLIGDQENETITFEEMADKFQSVHTEINLMAGSMNEIKYL
ncbi:alanine racemase [Sunxiuqinia indica]|uniref:alanine racemase n=1 Tax=Sunxiuqinia indica TaxID=2692584 RepID=UPI0013582E15|nr:alanine racemase [Sunxiuqinia indica]